MNLNSSLMDSTSAHFYEELPVLEHFFEASDPSLYHALPSDWFIAVTDIVNSTQAVEQNQYKSVNILGAAPIAGVLNIVDRDTVPYIFGGDGSLMAIPPRLYDSVRKILASCRKVGSEAYGLNLRAALIPVSFLNDQGKEISVARFRVSEYYLQALLRGSGIRYAEQLLKDPHQKQFQIDMPDGSISANFSGLECRWKEVKTARKEVMTLLVCENPMLKGPQNVYRSILDKLQEIFGFDDKTNPITPSALSMQLSVSGLMGEARLRTFGMNWLQRRKYILKAQLQVLLGRLFMKVGVRSSETDWSLYKPDLALNSDHRKFDDMLRIIISGTMEQRKELERYLEQQYRRSQLAYGLHVTDSVLVTCMVFHYHREHIHFVDGSNGGYVMAARQLKERLKALRAAESAGGRTGY